jgi:hypothetical protein
VTNDAFDCGNAVSERPLLEPVDLGKFIPELICTNPNLPSVRANIAIAPGGCSSCWAAPHALLATVAEMNRQWLAQGDTPSVD